eukprot:TRINITY_DN100469_c0_g1_i1.p1 TRINITY_DN100469_c0_g1~~TRINITY_DN100469_c0_g1_i1.p1  ORF type:complete len:536 (+),score=135.74 TRINITY_DN100469_c0_g1_i1:71-1678(+)
MKIAAWVGIEVLVAVVCCCHGALIPSRGKGTLLSPAIAQFDATGTGMSLGVPRAAAEAASRATLLKGLEDALGLGFRTRVEQRLASAEELLRPLFATLPQDSRGRISAASARYVLSRLLRERRSWVLGGLLEAEDTAGTTWLSHVLVPQLVQSNSTQQPANSEDSRWAVRDMFQQRLDKRGLDRVEVAVLAAVVEQLVHNDMRGKLQAAFLERGLLLNASVDAQEADDLIDLSMMGFLRGLNISYWKSAPLVHMEKSIAALYPPWPKTQELMRKLRQVNYPDVQKLNFDEIANIVEEATDRFGHWNEQECQATKKNLMELEDAGSGRVKLMDFYNAALFEHKYEFTETVDYLKETGALDVSDDLVPRVIIANYVQGPSNCVARTAHYSVCCHDECEELFGSLEKDLKASDASPAELWAAVMPLQSEWSQNHSSWLRARLDDIAGIHGGRIPIHARLFTQWMHFAHPRRCRYAHIAGTTPAARVSLEQWEHQTGRHSAATMKDLWGALRSLNEGQRKGTPPFTGMWSATQEELYAL